VKKRIFTPGPTPLPEIVKLSQAEDIIHHRTQQFSEVLKEVSQGLKYVFQTNNPVLTFAASGTGAMEAAVANLLSLGDKVLVIRGGKFGGRWTEICQAFGTKVINIDIEWGTSVDPSTVEKKLKENQDIKAVFTQLVETSTGVVYDIESIAKIVSKTSAILVVDAISGLGAQRLSTDEWGVDVVVGGSQKALMLPPGLSFVTLSQRAWKIVENSNLPRYYWDFKKAKKSLDKEQTPYTPAVSLICALKESLRLIKEEGWENVIKRHSVLARATREAISALGLSIFGHPTSNVLTSVLIPSGVNEKELRGKMQDKYGVLVAGGQAQLSGKIIRIAHLGWMDSLDVITVISALEMSLKDLGYRISLGEGVKTAEEILRG